MNQTKKQKKFISALLVFAVMAMMYGFVPRPDNANAVDAIKDARDLISDSDVSVASDHTFTFTNSNTTEIGYYIDFAFPEQFGTITIGNATCPDGGTGWTKTLLNGDRTLRCTATAQRVAAPATTTITGITNPDSEATRYIEITHYNGDAEIIERVTVAVAIIEDVLMTAKVTSSLTFEISGTSTDTSIGGIPCSNASTATSTPFGTLVVNATSTVCQTLNVTTNADDGYTVTVFQDHELLSDSGSNINSFNNSPDNTGSTTAEAWVAPTNILDAYHTYGHMGLHSDDSDLEAFGTGYNNFDNGGTLFAGLNSSDPLPVMHHDGPSDGTTADKGQANVIYQVEIGSLQEAGDYQSTLTYICTPIF